MVDRHRRTRALPAIAGVLAVAQPLSTQAARWTARGTREVDAAAATEGPVTPASGAFVIWAPLFGGCLLYAASAARARQEPGSGDAAGWWANAAMAGNVAWSLNAQFRRLDEASIALITGSAAAATTATAIAERHPDHPTAAAVRRPFGALAGWLAVATFATIETALDLRQGRPDEHRARRRAVALVGAASTVACGASALVRSNPFFRAAAGWGLGGIAIKALRGSEPIVAAVAGIGMLALGAGRALAVGAALAQASARPGAAWLTERHEP